MSGMIVADGLLAEFLSEATSHLDAADRELARLPQDGPAAILGILRRIHTIRGTAGFLDLPHLEQLQVVEIVLDDLRNREVLPDDVGRRVRGALAIARAIVTSAERPVPVPTRPTPQDRSDDSARQDGPLLLVPGAAIDRMAGLAAALASPDGSDPGLGRALTAQLGREIEGVRRQPLSSAWSKLGRLVAEIAAATGKTIAFDASGGDVTLDYRAVLLVRDALTHLVRNAAHHGIETPAGRLERGKPLAGSIRVSAETGPGEVVIDVVDDGAGLDLDAIRSRAVTLGLMSDEAARGLDDARAAEIVFAPGFSTSDRVGALSGLGIGLDVVCANIAELGGRVSLDAMTGAGLRIAIAIPIRSAPAESPRRSAPQAAAPVLVAARRGAGRDTLQRLLSTLGHAVETADDAGSALATALGRPLAAIIADHDLPDRPGLDLARALRRHPPTAALAIVLLLPSGTRVSESDRRSLDLVAIPHPFGRTSLRGPVPGRSAA